MSTNNLLHQLAVAQTSDLQSQIEHGVALSNESKLHAFVDAGKSTLSNFLGSVGDFLSGSSVGSYKVRSVHITPQIQAELNKGFAEIRTRHVNVPPGFSASYKDYIRDANQVAEAVSLMNKTLATITTRLAQILNEPDRLKAQTALRELEHDVQFIKPEQLDRLNAHFKNGSRTQTTLSSVAASTTAVKEAYEGVGKLNHVLAQVDFGKAQSQISRLADLVKMLKAHLDNEENKEVAGAVASRLADVLYKTGVLVSTSATLAEGVGLLSDSMLNLFA